MLGATISIRRLMVKKFRLNILAVVKKIFKEVIHMEKEKNSLDVVNANYKTVEDFWNNFIVPRLPKKDIVLKMHDTLMKYIELPDAVFPIRYDAEDYKKLRGRITKTNEGYSFVYCDNEHAKYYFQMCYDGKIPSAEELRNDYDNNQFAFAMSSKTPKLLIDAGCKLSHIVGVGEKYNDLERVELIRKYFPASLNDDWQKSEKKSYYRMFNVNPDAKKYLIAYFLRYVHPFNQFVSPAKKLQKSDVKFYQNDVGEHRPLVKFVRDKFRKIYGEDYDKFLSLIMAPPENSETDSDNMTIDLRCKAST